MSISDEIKKNLEKEGYTHFLRKNISPKELIKTIEDTWNEYSESKEK